MEGINSSFLLNVLNNLVVPLGVSFSLHIRIGRWRNGWDNALIVKIFDDLLAVIAAVGNDFI